MSTDYYQILGLHKGTSDKEIKKAYRKLATEYHPDKTKGDKAKEERFKEISEAYQVLGNKEKRNQYDTLGTDWEQFQQSGASYEDFMKMREQRRQYESFQHQRSRAGGAGGYGATGAGAGDFSDIFESFFGGGAAREYARPGADVSGEITISLMEAYTGTERLITIDSERIKMKIKPGAYDGLQLRAKGKGQKGSQGHAGDLYINVRVTPDPRFERKGDDLFTPLKIDLFTALLGGKIDVNTPSGLVKVPVKKGSQQGKQLRLKGKGMPVYGRPGTFGDMYVGISVELPKEVNEEQKELIEKLQKTYE